MMSGRPCAECDPSSASTASVSSDLHKYHVACSCGNGPPGGASQYAECSPTGPNDTNMEKIERPPALPPRPPPRPQTNANTRTAETNIPQTSSSGPRKYVWWCVGMGATSCVLGGLLLTAAILLRTMTISLQHLETIPTPIPAIMLVLTGLCIISLARRKNRYNYLIKIVGACCLVCALTCVLVTITTTVIHMNRLQTLRQCFYTDKTKTCVCSSILMDSKNVSEDEGVKCVFEEVADCDAVHGSLYRCLSAIFGLSVAGVLVCICSAMLAYQLLSHEKKKMYWEQLELRCRSLYRPTINTQTPRPHNQQSQQVCGECCTQCRAAAAANWDLQQRFWASGRVGNLYSPNPGSGRRVSPWSWFPWARNSNQRVGGGSSGDSAYGFGNTPSGYWQLGPPPPYTPHHRYFHHHSNGLHHSHSPIPISHTCSMMNQQNQSNYTHSLSPHGSVSDLENQHLNSVNHHHHHHQGSIRLGMEVCHQANQIPVRVVQCHDPTLLSLNPGHFVPINENEKQNEDSSIHQVECHLQGNLSNDEFVNNESSHISQHTCQKHAQLSDEETRVKIQGEENLAFQCEKQILSRQGRSGESELYFADVSSCCNMSLKAVEYCAGLVGTIEAQTDTSSGDSDIGSCPAFKNRTPKLHQNRPNLSSPCLNHSKWKKENSSPNCSSPNRAKKKGPLIIKDNEINAVLQLNANKIMHYHDSMMCYNCPDNACLPSSNQSDCQIFSNVNRNKDLPESKLTNIKMNANQQENIENTGRLSIRMKSSPNRSSMLNDVGLPSVVANNSLLIINNDLNLSNASKHSFDDSKNSDLSLSFNQMRKKGHNESMSSESKKNTPLHSKQKDDEDISGKRKHLDESLLSSGSNESSSPFKRKNSLSDSDGSTNRTRKHFEEPFNNQKRKNIEHMSISYDDTYLNKDFDTAARRKSVEDSLNKRKGIDESFLLSDISPMRRKIIENLELSDEGNLQTPTKRKYAGDSDAKLKFMCYSEGLMKDLSEASLVAESEGSRRGIIGGVCIAPDLRYEPVQGFENNLQICDNSMNNMAPMHMRCCSDSNTMDSGWQSGSEKLMTD